jgi:hypothetical protein
MGGKVFNTSSQSYRETGWYEPGFEGHPETLGRSLAVLLCVLVTCRRQAAGPSGASPPPHRHQE